MLEIICLKKKSIIFKIFNLNGKTRHAGDLHKNVENYLNVIHHTYLIK